MPTKRSTSKTSTKTDEVVVAVDPRREAFAAAALTGLLAASGDARNLDPVTVKAEAYAWADIMLA